MNKTGCVMVSDIMLFDESYGAAIHALFAKFVPLDVEISPQGYRDYYGYCEDFEEITEGYPWPYYECKIVEDKGTFTAEFVKV